MRRYAFAQMLVGLICIALFAAPAAAQSNWRPYIGGSFQYINANYGSPQSLILPSGMSNGFDIHVGERFGTYYARDRLYE